MAFDFMSMKNYFRKKPPIIPKFIINRDDVVELTLAVDVSSTVARLRTLLVQRLPDLSENEQFIHSNGAPIHILDENETMISELLHESSNVIFLKTKSTRKLMTASNSMELCENKIMDTSSYVEPTVLKNQQRTSTLPGVITPSIPFVDTITLKSESGEKTVLLSNLLSNATLEVDNKKLSPTDIKRIVSALKQNNKVKQLRVVFGCHDVIEILVEVLNVNRTLTDLDISFGMNDGDCVLIANTLINNRSLEKLTICRNEITSVGCKAIGEMLKSNITLKYLKICRNNLRDEGVKFICEALMINQTLCRLDIYQTKMSANGCAFVAQMLRMNRTLTLIDIGDNSINDDDITVIANALKSNSTLIELDAKWNKISEIGALALIDTLTVNRTLKTVKLQFNSMPQDVEVRINQKAPQLKTTGLGICSII
ncbi:unnamed protein product [Rotaria magnacalcarata]|uniref:Uncharacterized protein n=2 Tax=Rotaria magnacalcarata TaxID=392030 RepID=A0A816BML3_9BILA|nr:unnamed protein product [Rotaria magnacalcarata]